MEDAFEFLGKPEQARWRSPTGEVYRFLHRLFGRTGEKLVEQAKRYAQKLSGAVE